MASLELDRAALHLASIEYPNLAPDPFIAILDSHAAELCARAGSLTPGAAYVEAANQYLFGELGFTGNTADYYNPRNSCLNDVLTARIGIPITLAVVYIEIARRLAQPVCGISLPGHFLVRYQAPGFTAYIDVFNAGRLLQTEECFDLARQATGSPLDNDPALLAPAGKREIVTRMARNLRSIYLHRRAYPKALQVLDLLVAADPHAADDIRERGLVHLQMRNLAAGCSDLESYLSLAPQAADRPEIERQLRVVRNYRAGLN